MTVISPSNCKIVIAEMNTTSLIKSILFLIFTVKTFQPGVKMQCFVLIRNLLDTNLCDLCLILCGNMFFPVSMISCQMLQPDDVEIGGTISYPGLVGVSYRHKI